MAGPATTVETELRLSAAEVELLRAALRLLRSILGRDEAEELEEVQALLRRLEAVTAG
jgi:hypothetical protein